MPAPDPLPLLAATTGIAASGAGAPVTGLARYQGAAVMIDCSAVPTGGSPTLDVYVQKSLDGGATWQDVAAYRFTTAVKRLLALSQLAPAPTTTQAASDGALASDTVVQGPFGDRLRVKYAVSLGGGSGTWSLAAWLVPVGGP